MSTAHRKVKRMIPAKAGLEGEGFLVHRAFPSQTLLDFDPFLLLDEMGPIHHEPGEAKGAPDHPHRGFETVTYMLSGSFEHNDSFGHNGKLEPGDVQWMTAGSGLIHSEMPEKNFLEKGGLLHGIQLWINLPKEHKMTPPHYQEIKSVNIPVGISEDSKVKVRVLAGEALNAKAVIQTRTPIFYLHATIEPGGRWEQPILKEYNVFAYVLKGEGLFSRKSETNLKSSCLHQMVMFDNDGDSVELIVPKEFQESFEVLLIGGIPIKEPIVRYGPFVMNTEEEIRTAFIDYHTGKMGTIKR